jgi:hypothetical protein
VRQHFLSGIKPKNPRTGVIAIYDATIGFGEDDAGYVSVEQYAIEVSPHRRFVLNHSGRNRSAFHAV